VGAVSDTAIPYGARIHQLAEERGGETALVFAADDGGETQHSWTELDERSTRLARRLGRLGLGIGDRVAIKLRNSPEHLIGAIAAWKVGAVPVPVRWDLPAWELDRLLTVLDPKLVLAPEAGQHFDESAEESAKALDPVVPPHGWGICSSGSTGTPKVIVRDTPGVIDLAYPSMSLIQNMMELPYPQLILVPAPLYHTNGFTAAMNLLAGDRVVLMERFRADRLLELAERHRVTGFIAATPMLHRMAQVPELDRRDLSSVLWIQQGASLIPQWLARFWIERIGPEHLIFSYGSTEGAGLVICNGVDYLAHPGTLGRGWRGTEIRIIDPDSGGELPPGQVGEIYMRMPHNRVARYLGDVAQVTMTEDGFATIGDMGWLDEEGWLYMADRRVDMIVTGGVNVFPAEVEMALSEHPDVADVVVVGLKDPDWGRRVHAIVAPRAGTELDAAGVTAFAKQRLAPYKVPKTVEIVAAIPRSEALKVSRAALVAERDGPDGPDGHAA
jgi:bile acid-coenzyme A ligase